MVKDGERLDRGPPKNGQDYETAKDTSGQLGRSKRLRIWSGREVFTRVNSGSFGKRIAFGAMEGASSGGISIPVSALDRTMEPLGLGMSSERPPRGQPLRSEVRQRAHQVIDVVALPWT